MMIAAFALLATSIVASAQPNTAYQDQQTAVGEAQMVVNQKSQNFQYAKSRSDDSNKKYRDNANDLNQQVDKKTNESGEWLARHQIYSNVISLRYKDKVMAAVDEAREKLGVSEKEGYQRMGAFNPYSGESYLKYYDPKTGELVIGEIRALYKNLEAKREDFQQSCDRLHEKEAEVSKYYQDALNNYQAARDTKQEKDNALYERAKAQENLNRARADAQAAEMERQRMQRPPSDDDDPYYRANGTHVRGLAR
jgi:hypothetical protein